MKNNTIQTIFLMTLACVATLACNKSGGVSGEEGAAVDFSITSGSISTRTEYSGKGEVQSGKLVKERINWKVNDLITIWSDKATHVLYPSRHWANYAIKSIYDFTNVETDLECRGVVDPVDGNGLRWGSQTTEKFNFYGRYPADESKIDGTMMTGTIPASQTVTWTSTTSELTGAPDMQYAYMFASALNKDYDQPVRMDFNPMFTAFEFTIDSGENASVTVKSFELSTSTTGGALAGTFTLTYPSTITTSGTSPKVTVSLLDASGTAQEITQTKPLRFTVFALPIDLTDLSIKFTDGNDRSFTLKLNYSADASANAGQPIEFGAKKKHRIYGLHFPSLLDAAGEYILWDQEVSGENLIWDN